MVSTICNYLKVQHESLTENIINYLIAMWLKYKYLMKDFPWYITPSETQSDFFLDKVNSITVSILCFQSNTSSLDDFVTLLQETKTDLLMVIKKKFININKQLIIKFFFYYKLFLANTTN